MTHTAGFAFVEVRIVFRGSAALCFLKIRLAKSVRARKFATNQMAIVLVNQLGQ
jgi:hypothetical protein